MKEWQPIETAPKDGTFVILHVPHAEPPVSIGFYDGGPEWLIVEGDIMATSCFPDIWMPLPAPPTSSTGAAEGNASAVVERSAFVCGMAGER